MNIEAILAKQESGLNLTEKEISWIVKEYTNNKISDYDMTGFLYNVCQYGMSDEETVILTKNMIASGEVIDLSSIPGIKVDKHSTGGVGDKVTLVVSPLVASCNVPVAKMSGKALGFTGGTIDKLESIPGFNTTLDKKEFIKQIKEIGIAITSQTGDIVPADKKMYALRDVTDTVESKALIASSIMSKKLASGADKIVLDIKVGDGALMKTKEEAISLAKLMVKIGNDNNKETVAILSDMSEPLGYSIGNSLEVEEAINILKGNAEPRIKELCLTIASYMVCLGKNIHIEDARKEVEESLSSGKAYTKFDEFISAQGGNLSKLPKSQYIKEVTSDTDGYITKIHTEAIGEYVMKLGAGREKKEDTIEYNEGIKLSKKIGDQVQAGDLLATIHTNTLPVDDIKDMFIIEKEKPSTNPVILEVIK